MIKTSDKLIKISTGRLCLLALIIFLAFVILVLPGQSARAEENTGASGSPDLSLFYTVGDLYGWARSYGQAGRTDYIIARFTFDLVWPLVYGFFLVTAISWLVDRVSRLGSPWRITNLVPLLGMLFDYLENVSASIVMARYPAETDWVAWLATLFTPLKWISISLGFLALVSAAIIFLWIKFQRKNTADS